MTVLTPAAPAPVVSARRAPTLMVGLIGFLTLVDLFAVQSVLPTLARHYRVGPAEIGLAANASTLGMGVAGLLTAVLAAKVDRRTGVWVGLGVLAVPTALLAFAPDLTTFALLRVLQGLCMATAFTLTMAYLAERCTAVAGGAALAAYVTGGVASNLVGRLVAAAVVDQAGPEANFLLFAALNLAGAAVAAAGLKRAAPSAPHPMLAKAAAAPTGRARWLTHLGDPELRRAFALGFLILFMFLGVFTYVNFVLAAPPLSLAPMALGLVYLVFLPSMVTTPLTGRATARFGVRRVLLASFALTLAGTALLLAPSLILVLAGLAAVGIGTFFAQAATTGYVGRTAKTDRAGASGLYLASYYFGGLAGAALVGQAFDRAGWPAAVAVVAASVVLAGALALSLRQPSAASS